LVMYVFVFIWIGNGLFGGLFLVDGWFLGSGC